MNFSNAYSHVKSKLPLVERLPKDLTVMEKLKTGPERIYDGLETAKNVVKDNKDIIIPLTATAASFFATYNNGYPFPEFDKLMHFSFGYGMSRLGRKIARKLKKEKYESVASLATALSSGVLLELWETSPVINSISDAVLRNFYSKVYSSQAIDPLDIGANLVGSAAENIREYAGRAKEAVLSRFERSPKNYT